VSTVMKLRVPYRKVTVVWEDDYQLFKEYPTPWNK
jgi:hypothetical protein